MNTEAKFIVDGSINFVRLILPWRQVNHLSDSLDINDDI